MNTKILVAAVIGLLVGAGGGMAFSRDSDDMMGNSRMSEDKMMNDGVEGTHHATDGMMAELSSKTGDEFDKAFLAEMIVHHEGAVDMANAALKNAKHEEIKQMANAIMSSQTVEIEQMKKWQKSWYGIE